ncbi:unnamed protein product [Symbiodinium necroappetens]|uniref:Uncharacterized protein n=1 Tax=Symbiodinium necroappetens TaxID=1628268 RepID=A0A812ZN03_9DINO|nr:unnamed protein product [Symbiodinium necroappetens]
MNLASSNLLEVQGFETKLKANNLDGGLVQALVQSMNSQAELLKHARAKLEAAIAHQDSDDDIKQLLYCMNHANDNYKTASKHVRVHAQPPKPKAKAKNAPKSAPSAKGGK